MLYCFQMSNADQTELEIVPGLKTEPFFKTPEEYAAFRDAYIEFVTPRLEELKWARIRSEQESMRRIVN